MKDMRPLKRKKNKDGRYLTSVWTLEQKLHVVTTYMMLGNMTQTSLVTGVPYQTIERWKLTDWWKEFALKLQNEDIQQMDSNMRRVVDKALKAVEDRLDNGDAQYDQKTGKMTRIPVKAHVALKISTELLTKQEKLNSKPVSLEIEKTIDARLLKLAEEFSRFATEAKGRKQLDIPMVVEVVQA